MLGDRAAQRHGDDEEGDGEEDDAAGAPVGEAGEGVEHPAQTILGVPMNEGKADIVVMKFGGTSVAGAEQIKRAARRIVAAREAGSQVVAVLSARGKTTDELVAQALEISARPDSREMDMLLSTGERISCALCAMAIHDMGHKAISLTGSQAGIVTDSSHTKARIIDVQGRADQGDAAARTGSCWSPASRASRPTAATSPRWAAAAPTPPRSRSPRRSGRGVCEIYTDVAGVFSADPRIVPGARKLPMLSYEEMLEMAASGAGCCSCARSSTRATTASASTAAAASRTVPVPSSLSEQEIEQETVEQPFVTAVTHSDGEARVTLSGVRDEPGVAGRIFTALAEAGVNVDVIIQNEPGGGDGARRPLLHGRPHRPRRRDRDGRRARRQPGGADRRADRQGLDRRRRHALPSRRRRQGLPRCWAARGSTSR